MKVTVGQFKEKGFGLALVLHRRTKVSFYGIYVYNQATTRIFPYEKAEKVNTIDVLKKLRVEFLGTKMTVVWDGAPYHRAKLVREAASALDIRLQPLPASSPDFMPVEHRGAMVERKHYISYLL